MLSISPLLRNAFAHVYLFASVGHQDTVQYGMALRGYLLRRPLKADWETRWNLFMRFCGLSFLFSSSLCISFLEFSSIHLLAVVIPLGAPDRHFARSYLLGGSARYFRQLVSSVIDYSYLFSNVWVLSCTAVVLVQSLVFTIRGVCA